MEVIFPDKEKDSPFGLWANAVKEKVTDRIIVKPSFRNFIIFTVYLIKDRAPVVKQSGNNSTFSVPQKISLRKVSSNFKVEKVPLII
jgi:hypothetical protein